VGHVWFVCLLLIRGGLGLLTQQVSGLAYGLARALHRFIDAEANVDLIGPGLGRSTGAIAPGRKH
jgi:hypothetical protein